MMKHTRWNLLRSIVLGSNHKDEHPLESIRSSEECCGTAEGTEGKMNHGAGSRSLLLSRQLSRSDTALINPLHFTPEFQQSEDETRSTKNNSLDRFDKSKERRRGSSAKVPEIMSRFLKRNSQRIHRTESDRTNSDKSPKLRHAVRKFDPKKVYELLAIEQIDVNGAGSNGITALHEASIDGNLVCLKMLLSHGAEINIPDSEGFTPLDYAVFGGNYECAAYLIERGAKEDHTRDGQIMYQDRRERNRSKKSATIS